MKNILQYKYYFILFFILGFIVYFPILSNGFVWDDFKYILNNPQINQPNYTIFFDNLYNSGYMYRQITPLYFNMLYTFFGTHALPYHTIQLLFHIIVTSLIFILFTNSFGKVISLLLSLLFLIHPINVETVAWVSSTQTLLYTIFGLLALLIVQIKKLNERKMLLVGILILLSMLTYEFGLLYLIMIFIFNLIYKKNNSFFLFLLIGIICFYFLLRYIGKTFDYSALIASVLTPSSFQETIYTIPSILLYYLNTFLFPRDLFIQQQWIIKEASLQNFILPIISFITLILLFVYSVNRFLNNSKSGILFFSLWFIIGLIPLLHFIQLHMTVADRWFYFPFIGLLGIIGHIILRYKIYLMKYNFILIPLLIIILSLYSYRTFVRTMDWKDEKTLFTHDLKYQPTNIDLNYNLATAYYKNKEYDKAIPYIKTVVEIDQKYAYSVIQLGDLYKNIGVCDKAIYYYKLAIKEKLYPQNDIDPLHFSLIECLQKEKNYTEINKLITDKFLVNNPYAYTYLYYRAQANVELKEYKKAQKDAEFLYKNTLDPEIDKLYKHLQNIQK